MAPARGFRREIILGQFPDHHAAEAMIAGILDLDLAGAGVIKCGVRERGCMRSISRSG